MRAGAFMQSASDASQWLFTAIVAAIAILFLVAARRVARAHPGPASWLVPVLVLALWVAVPGWLAWQGRLGVYAPLPTLGTTLFVLLTIATSVLAGSPWGRWLAQSITPAALVGYQVFRLPLELVLHSLYQQGVIPVQMTYSGRNFDIVTALLAVPVALLLHAGRCPRWLLLAWNLLGLALLVNIAAVAILSTPVPFRAFSNEPANLLPGSFPFVWLPTVLVQAALFGHLLVFRRLRGAA
jgi:hypothetical protein